MLLPQMAQIVFVLFWPRLTLFSLVYIWIAIHFGFGSYGI